MKVNPLLPFIFYVCAGIGAALFLRDLLVHLALFVDRLGYL